MSKIINSPIFLNLTKPRPLRFCISLLSDYLGIAIGMLIFFSYPSIITFLLASIIIGASQHALAVLGHEAVHGRICKNRKLNDFIGNIFCFFPVGITVSTYREFHLPHHNNPNSHEDPEIPLRTALGKNWTPPFKIQRALKLWIQSFVGLSLKELATFVSMLPRGKVSERLFLIAFSATAIFIAIKTENLIVIGLWAYSLSTSYFSFLRFQGWYEHSLSNRENTNRYSIPSWIFRFILPHNIWVHYEHHKYPSIPFYNLELVRTLDSDERIYSFSEMLVELDSNETIPTSKQKHVA